MIDNGQPMVWIPEERVGSWMMFIFTMPNSDPVQKYSPNFRKQEDNLAWDSRRQASRILVRLASRTLVRTPSAFLPAKRSFSHKEPFLRPRGSGKLFLVCKMVTRMVRHYDQEKRQSDAALHRDTIRLVLLKAFAKHGAPDFFLRKALASTCSWRKQQGKIRVPRGFQKFLSLLSSNSRTLWWNINWPWVDGVFSSALIWERVYIFRWVVRSSFNLSLRTDRFRVERKATKDGRLSSSHHLTFSVEILTKVNLLMITQFLKKCTATVIGNENKMQFIG